MSTVKKSRGDNPNSYMGYALQTPRALFRLLDENKDVCIENGDDVAVLNKDGTFYLLEQVKTISTNQLKCINKDFVNTLYNWILLKEKDKRIINSTKYILFLENSNECDDLIINSDSACKINEAIEVVDDLVKRISSSKSLELKTAIEKIVNSKEVLIEIIQNFKLMQPNLGSTINDIDDLIEKDYEFLGDKLDSFKNEVEGWFDKATYHCNDDVVVNINVNYNEFQEFYARFNGNNKIVKLPERKDYKGLDDNDIYNELCIKQLEACNFVNDDNVFIPAYRDMLRAKKMISDEFENGSSVKYDLDAMFEGAKEKWSENKLRLSSSLSDAEFGKQLYLTSLKEVIKLDDIVWGNEADVSRGVHNLMANMDLTDINSIGWHRNYKKILDNDSDE